MIRNFKRRSITLEIMEELSEFNVIFHIIDSIIGFKGIVVNWARPYLNCWVT